VRRKPDIKEDELVDIGVEAIDNETSFVNIVPKDG